MVSCTKIGTSQTTYISLSAACLLLAIFYILTSGGLGPGLQSDLVAHDDPVTITRSDSASIQLHPELHSKRPPRDVRLEWNVTRGYQRPDGVKKEVVLINGLFPGPTIEARPGDLLQITVQNHLEHGEFTSIHWHGLKVSNDMDGVEGVTQCGIAAGSTFQYNMRIQDDQAGTFWYHSHSGGQRSDGLYGALIVHESEPTSAVPSYEDDQVLMVGDWYHRSAAEVLEDFVSIKNFKNEVPPDSMLLNGQGLFTCENAVPASPVDCESRSKPFIDLSSKATRLRIINVGSFAGFHIYTRGATFRTITADGGGHVDHDSIAHGLGIVHPGERVDIVVEQDESALPEERALTVQLDESDINRANLALSPCQIFPLKDPANDPDVLSLYSEVEAWAATSVSDYQNYKALEAGTNSNGLFTGSVDNIMLLYGTLTYLAEHDNLPRGELNHSTWTSPAAAEVPLLGLAQEQWPSSVHTVENGWVDVVLNNMDDKGHPFHLHGLDFWVLSRHSPSRVGSFQSYNPFNSNSAFVPDESDIAKAVRKDTVHVPSRGHVVLRVNAAAAGLWLFHCHVLWHQEVGMATALHVADDRGGVEFERLAKAAQDSCQAQPA